MEFSTQEYWIGLPFPSPGDPPNPGIELRSPALQADSLPSETRWKLPRFSRLKKKKKKNLVFSSCISLDNSYEPISSSQSAISPLWEFFISNITAFDFSNFHFTLFYSFSLSLEKPPFCSCILFTFSSNFFSMKVKVTQSCPTLCNTMDYTVRGILQARILEWVAFPFSRGSSQPRDWTQVSPIAGWFFTNWAIREVLIIIILKTCFIVPTTGTIIFYNF